MYTSNKWDQKMESFAFDLSDSLRIARNGQSFFDLIKSISSSHHMSILPPSRKS